VGVVVNYETQSPVPSSSGKETQRVQGLRITALRKYNSESQFSYCTILYSSQAFSSFAFLTE